VQRGAGRAPPPAVLSAAAAVLFVVTVVAQRALAVDEVPALTVVGLRYAIASGLLLVFLSLRGRPLLPAPGERVRAVLLGGAGYALQAVLFYLALRQGSAGTVAMLFYVYPAIVMVLEVLTGRVRPGPVFVLGVLLACAGAGVVVAAGSGVYVSPAGAALAVASGACIAAYLVINARLLPRTPATVSAAWVSLGTATSTLVISSLGGAPRVEAGHWPWLVVAGVTTGVATACMYAALASAPASRVAVVLALQTLVALFLGAWLLGEAVSAAQIAGGAAILAAAAVSTRARERGAA
jgi:drug/metabolite transporter (DMT)-like permease